MKISIDSDVLNNIYSDVSSSNKGITAGYVSSSFNLGTTAAAIPLDNTNIVDYIVDCGSVLDEYNVPETGRWLVLPTHLCNLVKKSDLKDASLSGDGTSILRNGRMGMIDRFTIYRSNNYTAVTDTGHSCYHVLSGHKVGLTFATQLVKTESLKSESTFGTIVRGLQVYGYKVTKPDCLVDLYCYKS